MRYLSVLFIIGTCYSYNVNDDFIEDRGWHLWKGSHNKAYRDIGEERVRYVIWQDNLKRIIEHNTKGHSYTLRMNHFGDLTLNEFSGLMNGLFKPKNITRGSTFLPPSHVVLPEEVDWTKEGYVTPVKNQGQCGSCWSFSATGALEGQQFKKTGKLVSLSEQNLVDCSSSYGNNGCEGGLMDNAFQYIKDNSGVDTEDSYPYEAKQSSECRFKKANVGATVTGFVDVTPQGSEQALQQAVASVGPVSVAIDASHFSFQFYSSGVYDEKACSQTGLDHGVLTVGYGLFNGTEYWLVKNSWGPGWGIDGYVRMARNKNNQCGIASAASYPLV